MEATAQVYLTAGADGGLTLENVLIRDASWYCENDHEAPADQVEALREHYKTLDAFGREPGSGGLDIPVFPAAVPDLPDIEAVSLATMFHDTYERLAPSYGYETRPETRRFDPDSPNGRLMVATCGAILEQAKGGT